MWRHLVWAPEDGQVDVDGWAPYTPLPQSKLGATWSDAGEGDSDLSKAVGLVLCRGMGSPEALAFTNSRGLLDGNICLGFPGAQTLELS